MSELIYEELVLEILQRLPAKSLARFCCVSKSWNSMIRSSDFIDRHLSCSSTNPLILARRQSQEREQGEGYVVLDYYDDDDFTYFPYFDINTLSYEIVGAVNGVICLWTDEFFDSDLGSYVSFALWNPTIHKYVEIPISKVLVKYYYLFGFGYKASENDFRVLVIAPDDPEFDPHRHRSFEADYTVQICSAREKIWRDLPAEILSQCFVGDEASRCLFNGVLHLVALDDGDITLLAFDFEAEEFSFMDLPEGVPADVVVTEYDDKLTALDYYPKIPCVKVWSMSEYGDPASWVCLFDVSLSTMTRTLIHRVERVLGITGDGEIIVKKRDGVFQLHDPESSTRHWLGSNMEHRIFRVYDCGFVESLVFMDAESNARCLPSSFLS